MIDKVNITSGDWLDSTSTDLPSWKPTWNSQGAANPAASFASNPSAFAPNSAVSFPSSSFGLGTQSAFSANAYAPFGSSQSSFGSSSLSAFGAPPALNQPALGSTSGFGDVASASTPQSLGQSSISGFGPTPVAFAAQDPTAQFANGIGSSLASMSILPLVQVFIRRKLIHLAICSDLSFCQLSFPACYEK